MEAEPASSEEFWDSDEACATSRIHTACIAARVDPKLTSQNKLNVWPDQARFYHPRFSLGHRTRNLHLSAGIRRNIPRGPPVTGGKSQTEPYPPPRPPSCDDKRHLLLPADAPPQRQ